MPIDFLRGALLPKKRNNQNVCGKTEIKVENIKTSCAVVVTEAVTPRKRKEAKKAFGNYREPKF